MHVNKINGKKYIGITKKDNVEHRWSNGKGYKGQVFYNAIRKYGWDNFEHRILMHGLTLEQACRWECKLIEHYNTMDSQYGYNRTTGGRYTKYSEETRDKIRNSKLGDKNPMYGKTPWNKGMHGMYPEETLKKMGSPKEKHPNWGKHLSKETKQKISDAQKVIRAFGGAIGKQTKRKQKYLELITLKVKKCYVLRHSKYLGLQGKRINSIILPM